jgi:hypothetical protein
MIHGTHFGSGASMRMVFRLVACAAIALVAASCGNPMLERKYINEGAGVDLYSGDADNQIALLNQYITFVCTQVGRDPCIVGSQTFVQAGMNDIDQRCDGYLTWLDARRRDQTPVLAEISAIQGATHDIMAITGSSVKSLNIVTTAFALATATYTNWNSRLLISVNQSTIQEVVYNSQWKYRDKIKNSLVPDQPTAIYLLRNYLRLCMPITIEASINTSTLLVQRDLGPDVTQPLVVQSTALPTLVRSIPPGGPRGPLSGVGPNQPPPTPEVQDAKKNGVEDRIPGTLFDAIQADLCVGITRDFDKDTREAIRQAKLGARQSSQDLTAPALFNNIMAEIKSEKEAQIFARVRTCSQDTSGVERGYLTAFEKFRLPGPMAINGLRSRLSKCVTTLPSLDSGLFDQLMRDAIMTIKGNAVGNDKAKVGDPKSGALNDQSYSYILKACPL